MMMDDSEYILANLDFSIRHMLKNELKHIKCFMAKIEPESDAEKKMVKCIEELDSAYHEADSALKMLEKECKEDDRS